MNGRMEISVISAVRHSEAWITVLAMSAALDQSLGL